MRYEKVGRTSKDRRTGKEREPIDKAYYICQTYNRLGKNACTSHKIEAGDLYNLVLADIQEVAAMASEKRFLKLTDAMEKEQESNQNRMQEIAALISEEEHSEGDVQMFMGESRRYAAIAELDETVLNRLINRILIGEPKKAEGVKTQEVRIVHNFVGEL